MHWMSTSLPNQVTDTSKRTKIFDYKIPISVAGKPTTIDGTLYWAGTPSGFPTAAVISIALIANLAVGGVVLIRRRRRGSGGGAAPEAERPTKEAW